MKQKRRGFTLIELLAVIVILAIIALIAVPVIMNIISKARENAFKDTMYGIVKAGELYYTEKLLTEDGMTEDVTFTFAEDGVSSSGLNIKGSLPTSGSMTVTKEGKIILNATDGVHTATKEEDSEEIIVVKGEIVETPEVPAVKTLSELAKTNDFATAVNACATSDTCAVGTPFAIEVAPGNIQNFYVISDVDNTVTLLMDRNIGETVAFVTKSDYLSVGGKEEEWGSSGNINKGPNYLESQTSGWTNIEVKDYTVTDNQGQYTITRTNARAKMLTITEATAIISNAWTYGNLNTGYGYWLIGSANIAPTSPFFLDSMAMMNMADFTTTTWYGVRPVIEISK